MHPEIVQHITTWVNANVVDPVSDETSIAALQLIKDINLYGNFYINNTNSTITFFDIDYKKSSLVVKEGFNATT